MTHRTRTSFATERRPATETTTGPWVDLEALEPRLLLAGAISGTVTDLTGTTPLANVWVNVFQGDDPNYAGVDARNQVANVQTDANGQFSFPNLPARHYRGSSVTITIRLDGHLCFKLYVASRLVIRGYTDKLAPYDLTYPKYLVLLAMSESDGQTVGTLNGPSLLTLSTMSCMTRANLPPSEPAIHSSRRRSRSMPTSSRKPLRKSMRALAISLPLM